VVLPSIYAMRRDCYLACGYDYEGLFRRSCLWDAASPTGPVRELVDSLLMLREVTCNAVSATNGSEYFDGGGGIFDMIENSIVFRKANLTGSGLWSASITAVQGSFDLFDKIKAFMLKIIGYIFGITPESFSVSDFSVAFVARIFGSNDTSAFTNSSYAWITNFNMDYDSGPVGLPYWLTVLTPFNRDCRRLRGDIKIFGIPIYNPFWLPALPIWVPNATLSVLRWSVKRDFIVPDAMIIDKGGCDHPASETITIPFTSRCTCKPSLYNCGERFGFNTPFDTLYFALDWILPGIANSKVMTLFSRITFSNGIRSKFLGVRNKANFGDYLWCAINSAFGSLDLVVFGPYIVSTFMMLGSLLIIAGAFWLSAFVAFGIWVISTSQIDTPTRRYERAPVVASDDEEVGTEVHLTERNRTGWRHRRRDRQHDS